MFKMFSTEPCPIQGEIHVNKPVQYLGPLTDKFGVEWDVNGIFSTQEGTVVAAVRRSDLHPHYTDTSGASWGLVCQSWKPYLVVIDEQE